MMEGPISSGVMAKARPQYGLFARTSEADRTPRAYATTAPERESYLARPPAVHQSSADSRSWSLQTEDALDAYKHVQDQHQAAGDQAMRIGYEASPGMVGIKEKSGETETKIGVKVTEYRVDSGNSDDLEEATFFERNQTLQEANHYAPYIDAAQSEPAPDQDVGPRQNPPKNHRMTKMIVKEDIDFFTALLEGHTPPAATTETQTFVHDETEIQRQSLEADEREADSRRREEAEAAKADTDFFMMLMQKD
ncbi:hypothetical protein diail_6213 [Diaporthe ilicicola]|nr:hypothetical protein diail_6213 [Diaporthe ilicicola]